jgi:hypothetical protein
VPDAIARVGKLKEETAITVNWVSDGIHAGERLGWRFVPDVGGVQKR